MQVVDQSQSSAQAYVQAQLPTSISHHTFGTFDSINWQLPVEAQQLVNLLCLLRQHDPDIIRHRGHGRSADDIPSLYLTLQKAAKLKNPVEYAYPIKKCCLHWPNQW